MIKKFKNKIQGNLEIFVLIALIVTTAISTTFFNYKKKIDKQNNENIINNIYLKKTLNHIINNLEPKYKRFNHQI
jgi:hypothetical protein